MSTSRKTPVESASRDQSTAPMMHIEANILSTDIAIDENGNLVIKNAELARMVEGFLATEQASSMQKQAAHLLCCQLSCPAC